MAAVTLEADVSTAAMTSSSAAAVALPAAVAVPKNLHRLDLHQAGALRERTAALLESLLQARQQCEADLARLKRSDAMKAVTGRSALDTAIARTKQTMEILNRLVSERRRQDERRI